MRLVDLTHAFTDNMPTYPGDPKASMQQSARIEKEGYADHWLQTGMHVGTHIDAPAHMITGGKKVHELPLELFYGKGRVMDVRKRKRIDTGIQGYKNIEKEEVVFFCTGFSKKYHAKKYFTDFPVMTEALAKELVKRRIKMVGFDTPSPDKKPFAAHKILLGAGILIIENLMNLEALLGVPEFQVHAAPMKLSADAAPARVVAVF